MIYLNKNIIYKVLKKYTIKRLHRKFFGFIALFVLVSLNSSYGQQAVISGDTTICSGGIVNIHLSLEGVAPWSVTIQLNGPGGTTNYTHNNIYEQDTILQYDRNGDFRITDAFDNDGAISFSTTNIVTANLFVPLTEAIISDSKSICEEDSYNARIDLKGNPPWDITYSYNGGAPIEVPNIVSSPYYLNISEEGTYSLVTVNDNNCPGTAVGTFTLNHYEKSTALLVGGGVKCEEQTSSLNVIFSGSAPYELEYMIDGEPDSVLQNITTSPFTFKVKEPGSYEIYEFTDNHGCIGTPSGSVTVSNYPDVAIDVNLNSTYALNSLPVSLEATPTGGEFKGDGVVTSTSTFYPELAVQYGTEPYEIIYTYENPSTGCIYNDTTFVNIIDSTASIKFPGGREKFCSNEGELIITGANIYNEIGSFSIFPNLGLTDLENDSAILDPAVLNSGSFVVTYEYWSGSSYDAISREIEVEKVDEVSFVGLNKTEFCGDDSRVRLNGFPPEGEFSGPGVEKDTISGIKYYFNPLKANVDTNNLIFSYTTPTGCVSSKIEPVIVHAIPQIDFRAKDSCVNENSPRPIKFSNHTVSDDAVISWEWKFYNNSGSVESTSSLENPTHVYTTSDEYTVSLKALTIEGCDAEIMKDITFEQSPLAGFVFSSECRNPDISILFRHTIKSKDPIDTLKWLFTDQVGQEEFLGDSIYYTFSLLDEHLVKLIAITTEGCVDTFEENIQLKPTTTLSDGPYFQDFETQNYWENEFSKALNNNSWIYGSTANSFTNTANNKAWYTKLEYSGEESSWIKSPCFDFSDVDKPFVKFNIWRDFEEIRDGANLQYTFDNGVTWNLVGTVDDGVNWYNSYQINGNPGGYAQGWSDLKDNKWVTVKHRLDELSGKTNVQFRIVYGSDGTNNENFGIAVDSVWFKERNYVVLLEHFTNSSDANSLNKDSLINEIGLKNINDLVSIQYHTDFPGNDILNLVNPLEVNARLLYYGYSDVPMSIVNGNDIYDYETKYLTNSNIIQKSLNETNFELEFDVTKVNNRLDIDYEIKSISTQNNRELFLYIVIVEDSILQTINGEEIVFMNTFRKFLPDPGGISLPSNWSHNEVYSNSYSWDIEKVENIENMKVVLFIQDGQNNRIIQAAIDKKLQSVDIDDNKMSRPNRITAYPNPFTNNLMIARDGIYGELKIDLLSMSGNLISTSILGGAEDKVEIDAKIPSGYYLLKVTYLDSGSSEVLKLIKY